MGHRNWHYRNLYLIYINKLVIHDRLEPEDFIEKKDSSRLIFICVRRQASGNLHVLHWVATYTKWRHDTDLPSQLVQP